MALISITSRQGQVYHFAVPTHEVGAAVSRVLRNGHMDMNFSVAGCDIISVSAKRI